MAPLTLFLGKDQDKLGMEWNLSFKQSKKASSSFLKLITKIDASKEATGRTLSVYPHCLESSRIKN